jgi:uncharacterized membrane protein YeaQ/YmgE (transglycosylase-associated protein family)
MRMIHFIIWIIASGIAGFIASKVINKSGSGMLMDIILGIVGGFVGGFIVNHLLGGLGGATSQTGFMGFIVDIIVAAVGAMLVIWLYDLIFRRKRAA